MRAFLPRARRRGRAVRRRGQAAGRLLRGARPDGVRALEDVCAYCARRRTAGDRGREARRHRLDRARVRGRVLESPNGRPPLADARDGEPVPRPRLARSVPRRVPPRRRRHLLRRQDVERRRRGGAGSRPLRRPARLAPGRRSSSRSGAPTSSASTGFRPSGAVIGATHPRAVGEARQLLPRAILLLPGVGAQGATPADVARAFTSGPASALGERLARRDLRLPRLRDGLAERSRSRGVEVRPRSVGRVRLVRSRPVDPRRREQLTRYGAPAAFLAAVTIAVILIKAGL